MKLRSLQLRGHISLHSTRRVDFGWVNISRVKLVVIVHYFLRQM